MIVGSVLFNFIYITTRMNGICIWIIYVINVYVVDIKLCQYIEKESCNINDGNNIVVI